MGQDQNGRKQDLKLRHLPPQKDWHGGTAKPSSELSVPKSLQEFLNRDSLPINF